MSSLSSRDRSNSSKNGDISHVAFKYAKPSKPTNLLLALGLAILAILLLTHTGIQYAMRALLVQHVHSTGMDWAHHIELRTPSLPAIVLSEPESDLRQSPSAIEFAGMVNGMLSVGNIYQVDIINPDCYCEISMGTYQEKLFASEAKVALVHRDVDVEPKSTTVINNARMSPSQHALAHALGLVESHAGSDANEDRFGLDRSFVQKIAASGRNDIVLHSSNTPNQPGKFAEIYRPVTDNGEISYIIRLMVDLDQEYARYWTTLYAGAGIIFLMVVAAFSFPTAKYLRTSLKQREADEQAHYLANHDSMTKANNRNSFQNIAPMVLRNCLKDKKAAAVYLFDVDNFKEVNDYHSHAAGDQVICALADMLTQASPPGSHVARLGGDEFAIIVGGIEPHELNPGQVLDIPTVIRVAIDDGRQIVAKSISGGVSIFPRDGSNLEELMRCADLALYAAKSAEGGQIREYAPHMSVDFYERLDLRDQFKAALEKSEIVPYYQPLVDMNSGLVVGFEALARWDHPQRGILTPFEFEEMLADHELSAIVGALMLKKTVQDMKRWKANAVPFETIGINVGEGDLLRPGFALNIISELKQNGLRPKNLAIEITESCMFGSNKSAFICQLESLRMAGCAIALDDFGTGYSSITQIKELPCTTVKIDKSFVNDVVCDKSDQAIIQSLLELGETLGFKLVLEGVETTEQRDLLRSLGCEIAQGYYYSRPIPASEVPEFLERMNANRRLHNQMRTVA